MTLAIQVPGKTDDGGVHVERRSFLNFCSFIFELYVRRFRLVLKLQRTNSAVTC